MNRRDHESNLPARDDGSQRPVDQGDLPGSGRAAGHPEGSSGFDWERYLSTIRRYKWIIILVTLVGTGAGVAVAHFMEAQYLAQATLWIEWRDGRGQQEVERGPIQSNELLESYNWVELLQSYAVLEDVVREQRLYLEPDAAEDTTALRGIAVGDTFTDGSYRVTLDADGSRYALWAQDSTVIERGAVGDSIGRSVGLRWAPDLDQLRASEPVEFSLVHPRDAARQLREDLNTFMLERGNFLRLELEGSDPERTEQILNAIATRFTELATELKRTKVDELTTMLEDQLQTARQNLDQSEDALESFRVQNAGQPTQGIFQSSPSSAEAGAGGGGGGSGPSLGARYQEVQLEIQDLQRQQQMIESALQGGQGSGATVDQLTTIPAVQQSSTLSGTLQELAQKQADLRALLQLYTREHEDVQRIEREIEEIRSQTIPQLARNLSSQLASREQALRTELEDMQGMLRTIPARTTQEAQLERRVRIDEELFRTLQSRHEEARIAAASTLPDVQVLDQADAGRQPISDDGPQVIALAFAGSLALALLGAILFDRLDTRVRYPEEISHGMGLRILGTIPRLKATQGVLNTQDAGAATEAFRTLRLNLSHAHGAAGPVMTTVTSPSPGDGKSFVSMNLALTYSRLGRKTLLIDGDIRKGRLYRLVERRRKPGLTDHLSNGKGPDDVIQKTDYENLDFIATGTGMQAGPELLQSEKMQRLMTRIKTEYDAIIVDSPPLGAGVDPLVLSTFTGNLLLVLRAGTTKRALAEAKLDLMTPLPIRILGAVLNDVGRNESYYKYYGNYEPGYEIRNQAVQEVSTKLIGSSSK